ncbi:MAG: hypothetical protein KAW47_09530 [Thermoplasmatales archaeon]|nr:hypothetical protein [Thermoplasmatales archaeon]
MIKKISSDRWYQTQRIRSIDIVKGICIGYIIWGHFAQYWMLDQDFYLWIRKWAEIFGPSIFLFIAGVNQSLSVEKRFHRGQTYGQVISYTSRNYIVLALIGLIGNIIINLTFSRLTVLTVFEYRILFGIALNILISWPLVVKQVSTYWRILIGSVFLIIGAVGYANGLTESIPYLFSNGRLPPFPNAGFAILGSVFGYYLFHTNLISQVSLLKRSITKPSSLSRFLIVSIMISIVLLTVALTPRLAFMPDPKNFGNEYFLAENPYIWGTIEQDGFPFIANVHSIFWASYCIGASMFTITLLWWILDVHKHAQNSRLMSVLEFYGTYSFSCYIYHSLFIGISSFGFQQSLPIFLVIPFTITAIGLIGVWIYQCVKYWNGNGTIERVRAIMAKWLGKSQFFTNLQGK